MGMRAEWSEAEKHALNEKLDHPQNIDNLVFRGSFGRNLPALS